MRIASDILRLAKDILVEVEVTFDRSNEVDGHTYRSVQTELQRLVDRVAKNEGLESFVTRTDTEDEVVFGVGFSDHEAKKAILEEFGSLASKLARRNGMGEVKVGMK